LEGRRIAAARMGFGGMAATPKRASQAEAALAGASLDQPASWEAAIAALARDFAPISDMRASASYRMAVAQGLLRKALMEVAGTSATRVLGQRRAVA
jgi:xanthine dehydrogenase small subunit